MLLIHGLGGTPTELRFIAQRSRPRRPHRLLLPARRPLRDARGAAPLDLAASGTRASRRPTTGCSEHCDIIIAGGLSMGGILATHLAQNRPEDVHGLLLFAPTLRLDGWSMPWYSRVAALRSADCRSGSSSI